MKVLSSWIKMFRHVVMTLTLVNILLTSGYKLTDDYRNDYRYQNNDEVFHDRRHLFNDVNFDEPAKNEYEPDQSTEMADALANLPKNGELFEDDIIMDQRLKEAVLGVSKRSAINSKKILWPGGVLFYTIDKSFTRNARELLKKAMFEFEKRTCITFKKRTTEKDYVIYTSSKNICSSNIGRITGPQEIFIGVSCLVLGTVEHETMHVLGFIHEHSRPDRDQYIKVMWENIEKDEWSNFNKYQVHDVTNMNVDYNFASVMHYRNDAFTKNQKDTLLDLEEPTLKFGQRIKFSEGDIQSINRLYGCPAKPGMYNDLIKTYSGQRKDLARKLKKERDYLHKLIYDEN